MQKTKMVIFLLSFVLTRIVLGDANDDLLKAAAEGRSEEVKDLVEQGADLKTMSNSCFMFAIVGNHLETVKVLIGLGADINSKSSNGSTPMMLAVNTRNLPIIKILVTAGADLTIKNDKGETALNLAMSTGSKDVINYLTTKTSTPSGATQKLESVPPSFTFRKTRWGMSSQEVRNAEGNKTPLSTNKSLMFKGSASDSACGTDCIILYDFAQGKLAVAYYSFNQKHTNQNDYIADYGRFQEKLKAKYGQPHTDDVVWKNDLYKTDPQSWGLAISAGHLVYETTWETGETKISLRLTGDNFEITLAIRYLSKELEQLWEQSNQKTDGF